MAWINETSTLQSETVGGVTSYRFNLGAKGFWPVSADIANAVLEERNRAMGVELLKADKTYVDNKDEKLATFITDPKDATDGQTVFVFPELVGMFPLWVDRSGTVDYTITTGDPNDNHKRVNFDISTGTITFLDPLYTGEFVKVEYTATGDGSIVPDTILLRSEFTEALQEEVNRSPIVTQVVGTQLVGASSDTLGNGVYRFNEVASVSPVSGNITQVNFNASVAGTVAFAIVTNDGTKITIVKQILTVFNAVVGLNTFTLNEPILVGQILAIGGTAPNPAPTASIKFGTSGLSGNRFVQGRTSTNIYGSANSYYSYDYTVSSVEPKPLDSFIQYGEDFTRALQEEVDRDPSTTASYGTDLIGGSTDGTGNGVYRFNETIGVIQETGIINSVDINLSTGGSIVFAIVTNDGTKVTVIKQLGLFTAVTGANNIVLNEPVVAGQILAIGGTAPNPAPNVVLKYGSGLTGNRFVQGRTTTNIYGGAGTYYSYKVNITYNKPKPLDDFTTQQQAANLPYYQRNITTTIVIVKKNGTIGVDCNFNGNRGIQNAIESITDASYYKRYKIVVLAGVYEATTSADFNSDGIITGMVSFIRMKSFVSLYGVKKEQVIIRGTLPNSHPSNTYQFYQTIYFHADQSYIENITVDCINGRYPIHTDAGQLGCKDFKSYILNCDIRHYGCPGNTGASGEWTSFHPYGVGTSDGQYIEVNKARLFSTFDCYYHHTNKNFAKGSHMKYIDCEGVHMGTNKTIGSLQSLGSGRDELVEFINCTVSNAWILQFDDNPYIPTELENQNFNHNDFNVYGLNMFPHVVRNNFQGQALRITSKSTGNTSTVRFDVNSSAYPLIVKDKDYVGGDFISDLEVVNTGGYAYKDGNGGIFSYAIGRLDIGSVGVGLAKNVYIKSLGKRLGDCSVVNKTLGIIIDGSTYNVVFDKNYNGTSTSSPSGYSNAQILAEINAVIGSVATASEYAIGNEVFPFKEYEKIFKSSESIFKGMVVYEDAGIIRKALSTDEFITGVAIDDITSGSYGRVIIKGYVDGNNGSDRTFNVLQDVYAATIKGEKFGISSTAGKISKTATIKHFYCFSNGILSFNL